MVHSIRLYLTFLVLHVSLFQLKLQNKYETYNNFKTTHYLYEITL